MVVWVIHKKKNGNDRYLLPMMYQFTCKIWTLGVSSVFTEQLAPMMVSLFMMPQMYVMMKIMLTVTEDFFVGNVS